jgi:hypothetical protein
MSDAAGNDSFYDALEMLEHGIAAPVIAGRLREAIPDPEDLRGVRELVAGAMAIAILESVAPDEELRDATGDVVMPGEPGEADSAWHRHRDARKLAELWMELSKTP